MPTGEVAATYREAQQPDGVGNTSESFRSCKSLIQMVHVMLVVCCASFEPLHFGF